MPIAADHDQQLRPSTDGACRKSVTECTDHDADGGNDRRVRSVGHRWVQQCRSSVVLLEFYGSPSIAKVTPTGKVLALAAGTATVSVAAGGQIKQVPVTVQAGSGTPGTIQMTLGPEEVVFQYTRDACMEDEVPDDSGPCRALKRWQLAPHYRGRFHSNLPNLARTFIR